MASGMTARLLHVDLASRETRVEELPETLLRKYLGGGALASYLLLRDMPPGVDPLGPDNVLVFTTSVINGLSLSGTNRYTAAAKSPLTGGYCESEAGGWWGPELRAAGYDGLVIRGQAESPVYLWIKDGQVEFRDARPYWGRLSGEVQDGLEQELGDKRIRVLQTGVAGERGGRFAAIVDQLKHFPGRGGVGAVMGAKRLKAIVVRGTKPPLAMDKNGARGALTWFREHYDRSKDRFHTLGSASALLALEASGILPTRNFRDGSFEHARAISGQKMAETILVNRGTCYAGAVGVALRGGGPAGAGASEPAPGPVRPRFHLHGRRHGVRAGVLRARDPDEGGHRRARADLGECRGGRATRPPDRPPGGDRRRAGRRRAAGGRAPRTRRRALRAPPPGI